ncbi:MAG: hypothetical protein KKI02_05315, partial [Planctomycetes bacterium]|nr:hypothetical protein [Planctomycetota bacterium]
AWSIGHLHFARRNQADLYMSIHVAFTGLRALSMPFLGLLANHLFGNGSFAIAVVFAVVALLLFRRLSQEGSKPARRADAQDRQPDDDATTADES